MTSSHPVIGVLALQGGVIEHRRHLAALGVANREVRRPGELAGLAGLILPGGESTCLGRLLRLTGVGEAIVEAHRREGMRLWGTCAGAILLATEIESEQPHLALLDIAIRRNAFGSQLDSFRGTAQVPAVSADPIPLVFIRAPQILRAGGGVSVLLRQNGYIAAVESGDGILATVFHPELSSSLAFHRHFAEMCGAAIAPDAPTRREPFLARARPPPVPLSLPPMPLSLAVPVAAIGQGYLQGCPKGANGCRSSARHVGPRRDGATSRPGANGGPAETARSVGPTCARPGLTGLQHGGLSATLRVCGSTCSLLSGVALTAGALVAV